MKYRDYLAARDVAWQSLYAYGVRELPVKVSALCKQLGLILHSYERGAASISEFGLDGQCKISDGFTVLFHGRYYIFYNSAMSVSRMRFTVAHELGHIVLGHVQEGKPTPRNREPEQNDQPMEHMANVYASRLLAPACVLHDLAASTPEQISALCDISLQSARYRAERMDELEQRNRFGTSPLERKVHRRFLPFILKKKLRG